MTIPGGMGGGGGNATVGVTITVNATGGAAAIQQFLAQLAQLRAQLAQIGGGGQAFISGVGGMADATQRFHGVMDRGVGILKDWISTSASLLTAMAGFNIFSSLAGDVDNLASSIMNLNVQTQQYQYMWQYQFGGPDNGGTQISQQIAGWLPNFAMKAPYTWQETMSAIGPISQLGLNAQGIERYMPMIADLASTHTSIYGGGGHIPIGYASLAIMEAARTGMTRRMLYELQINPRDLEQYGLKFDSPTGERALNPEMFLPALEAYSIDHGWTKRDAQGNDVGAAYQMTKNTWAGAWTSMIDRVQKIETRMGGMYVAPIDASQEELAKGGSVQAGSMFDEMLKNLNALGDWYDAHERDLQKLADLFAELGGKDVVMFKDAIEGLVKGLKDSGLGEDLLGHVKDLISWLGDPKNQAGIEQLSETIGKGLGQTLGKLADDFGKVGHALDDFNAKTKATGAVGPIFSAMGGVLDNFTNEVLTTIDFFKHLVAAIEDLSHGDVPGALGELTAAGTDLVSASTMGLVPNADQWQKILNGNGQGGSGPTGNGVGQGSYPGAVPGPQGDDHGSPHTGPNGQPAPTRDGYTYPALPPGYQVNGPIDISIWNGIMDRYEYDLRRKTIPDRAPGHGPTAGPQSAIVGGVGAYGPAWVGGSGAGASAANGAGGVVNETYNFYGETSAQVANLIKRKRIEADEALGSAWQTAGSFGFGVVGMGV